MEKEDVIKHNHVIDKLALLNALISGIALYPQVYLLLNSNQNKEGLSAISFVLILLNSVVWFFYGIHRKTNPLIISSFLNIVASMVILYLIMI
ncbi:MAG: PQ-loop domain-containing transporter [Patescibacteria group bacterium]